MSELTMLASSHFRPRTPPDNADPESQAEARYGPKDL